MVIEILLEFVSELLIMTLFRKMNYGNRDSVYINNIEWGYIAILSRSEEMSKALEMKLVSVHCEHIFTFLISYYGNMN